MSRRPLVFFSTLQILKVASIYPILLHKEQLGLNSNHILTTSRFELLAYL